MSEGSTTRDVKDVEKAHVQNDHSLEYGAPRPGRRRMANPAPIGLFSFAATTLLLSLFILHTRGIQAPNVIIGMAIFAGGLVQLLAGMWEVPNGNVFGATAFSSYGAFWMSYATIFIPGSGVMASFEGNMEEFNNAFGLYLMIWFMITVLFMCDFPPIKTNGKILNAVKFHIVSPWRRGTLHSWSCCQAFLCHCCCCRLEHGTRWLLLTRLVVFGE